MGVKEMAESPPSYRRGFRWKWFRIQATEVTE